MPSGRPRSQYFRQDDAKQGVTSPGDLGPMPPDESPRRPAAAIWSGYGVLSAGPRGSRCTLETCADLDAWPQEADRIVAAVLRQRVAVPVLHFKSKPCMQVEVWMTNGVDNAGVQFVHYQVVVLDRPAGKIIADVSAPIATENRDSATIHPGNSAILERTQERSSFGEECHSEQIGACASSFASDNSIPASRRPPPVRTSNRSVPNTFVASISRTSISTPMRPPPRTGVS